MIESLSSRHRDSTRTETYPQAVSRLDKEFDLRLPQDTHRLARLQHARMKHSHDLAHKEDHPLDLAWCIEFMVGRRPSLLGEVNWSQAFDFVSIHDQGRASIPLTPITLFSSQILEHVIAPIVARRALGKQRPGQVDEELIDIIRRHSYHAGHPKRRGREFSKTEQLVVDVDGLSVLTPRRVDRMYAHIKKAFFGMPLEPFHGLLANIFNRFTNFTFFYPEAEDLARSWRSEAEAYVREKFLRNHALPQP